MPSLHQLAFYLHISSGTLALLVFWIPVFTRKGSLDHRRYGRCFALAMYAVAGSGLLMASLDLLLPLAGHPLPAAATASQIAAEIRELRLGAVFLLSLSVLVLTTTRHGWQVIVHRQHRAALRTPVHLGLITVLGLVGAALLVLGLLLRAPLFIGFGLLELSVWAGMLRYLLRAEIGPKQWWIEHLGAFIGSGIGAYTAFFVFGGSRLLAQFLTGPGEGLSLLFWFGPGVIGSVATAVLTRQYRQRFAAARPQGT
jgi:hypothetical protein